MPRVSILPGDSHYSAKKMFEGRGWEVVNTPDTDLIVFLGGVDVCPDLYGAERHPMTQSGDWERDVFEKHVFDVNIDIPKVGICRGGQLLNVLNGGGMIQHLNGTRSGIVKAQKYEDIGTDQYIDVLVDHHQGMKNYDYDVVCDQFLRAADHHEDTVVSYACYYPETKSLCFQPHPEWGHKGTEDYFFSLIKEHMGM